MLEPAQLVGQGAREPIICGTVDLPDSADRTVPLTADSHTTTTAGWVGLVLAGTLGMSGCGGGADSPGAVHPSRSVGG